MILATRRGSRLEESAARGAVQTNCDEAPPRRPANERRVSLVLFFSEQAVRGAPRFGPESIGSPRETWSTEDPLHTFGK